jgi:hypothetical protein
MVLQEFKPEAGLYEELLMSNQIGHGPLGRYRGSDLQNGSGIGSFLRSMFSRVARFATPLIRTAAPHMKAALESAKPHLSNAANTVVTEASKNIVSRIAETLGASQQQQGSGKRKIIQKKHPKKRRIKNLSRIPPFDLPDSF